MTPCKHEYEVLETNCCYIKKKCKICGEEFKIINDPDDHMLDMYDIGEYVMNPPGITTILYSCSLSLTVESTNEVLKFDKEIITVGKHESCDIRLMSNRMVAKHHASFHYENSRWFIRDNTSLNGTCLNGNLMIPGKKYQLNPADEICFANSEKYIFYKPNHSYNTYDVKKQSFPNPPTIPSKNATVPTIKDKLLGKVIGDRYSVTEFVCNNGISSMFIVQDNSTSKKLSMKVWDKTNRYYAPTMRELYLNETYWIIKNKHPLIPECFDIIEDNEYIFIVNERIEGTSLASLLRSNGAQSADTVVRWAKDLCSLLNHFHKKTPPHVCRNIEPANIILTTDGSLKVVDFHRVDTCDRINAGKSTILGTLSYAAPECFSQFCPIDARTDIYSLGITMHYLVTGIDPTQPPYELLPVRKTDPALPRGLEYIISKCIERHPNDRYQNCDELIADLNIYHKLPGIKNLFVKLFKRK